MAIIHVTEATGGLPNSGRLSGTNGDLVGILDVALPLNGWAIEYSTGNARIYRPGSGNRFRLYVNDDSAISGDARLATVRGCENASAASNAGLVDPFPLAAQVADSSSVWIKSSAANTTARAFDIWVGETWVKFSCNFAGTTNVWQLERFGDFSPFLSGDSYNTMVTVRGSTNATNVLWQGSSGWMANSTTVSTSMYLARSYDGTVKSTRAGKPFFMNQSAIGLVGAVPAAFQGPSTGVDTWKVPIYDSGVQSGAASASLAMLIRGWIPNILEPLGSGRQASTPNARDVYHVTAVPAFDGQVVCYSNSANTGYVVIQTDDNWVPPNG